MHLNDLGFQGVALQWGVDAFVAPSVLVRINRAIATTHAHRVNHRAVTIALSFGNVCTAALEDGARPIADPTRVNHADAFVLVVAHAISVFIQRA